MIPVTGGTGTGKTTAIKFIICAHDNKKLLCICTGVTAAFDTGGIIYHSILYLCVKIPFKKLSGLILIQFQP